jgi:hypothetical protein
MTEADFNRMLRNGHYTEFRAAAWELFRATGQFVDVLSGQIYTAPKVFKNRPVV